ncbi:histidinol dehydrogenase [Halorhodospira halochloris]|uniref:Histidinol dehydrogenase n=1 Tax=Halorhodospira halochloris TaxID=1052 RepID=A0A0X8XAX1_HALHR|nr:histidinol dehydrogenase [Halorhodospira halochloris]MBK1651670.1 histidinol dehydrogenase [Halorhodospira halochloris]MCG5529592.1 histidinol dehydrogenase [Halorhodospira halochloris]MCG5548129.1 histidinol dehydrogenase [Halorhodospira halochloris]BAU58534.1 histidinol dehydrogenase [Halorhodospira halochloris]
MVDIKRLSTTQPDFWESLEQLVGWESHPGAELEQRVAEVVEGVRTGGDKALLEYTRTFDGLDAGSVAELEVSRERIEAAAQEICPESRSALEHAATRIRAYATRQRIDSWEYEDEDGNLLGQQVTAIDRVGVYVPGGKAAYPSSVLMNAVPARVAGVEEIVMTVPAPNGELSSLVLAAAKIAGVDRIFTLGGAQAVAALAYGTQTVPSVDKIVGPGNAYVAEAKRRVYGVVGIDMIAGPSEVLIISDGQADPEWIAMDLFSQAEHDEHAQALLVCPDFVYLDQVQAAMERMLPELERSDIVRESLAKRGALICVRDLAEAQDVANRVAPEHLELSVAEPQRLVGGIRHAGAIFLGHHTAESLGDYCAGPNHTLPTSRTARFASPLGVYDFQKRSTTLFCSPEGAAKLAESAAVIAHGEGLGAHAKAAEFRKAGHGEGN